jgi:RHS repeat-associated protein
VYGVGYVDDVVLRDAEVNGGGNLGITGSGLDQRLYYQQDREFNVTALVDQGGNVVERYAYDPYGSVSALKPDWTLQPDGASVYGNQIGFTGRCLDSTGMYYFRFRYMDPVLGTFISRDPLGPSGGITEYIAEFPPGALDPNGEFKLPIQPFTEPLPAPTPMPTPGPSPGPSTAPNPEFFPDTNAPIQDPGESAVSSPWLVGGVAAGLRIAGLLALEGNLGDDDPSAEDIQKEIQQEEQDAPKRRCCQKSRTSPSGHANHDAFVTKIQGDAQGWLVTNPSGMKANFDGSTDFGASEMFEAKTGHRWLNAVVAGATVEPWIAIRIAKLEGQLLRESIVAKSCGYRFDLFFDNQSAANAFNQINNGFIPVRAGVR